MKKSLEDNQEQYCFLQPHGVWTSWLGLCVGAGSGYKVGNTRFHSPVLLEDLSLLNSGTFLY